MNNLKKITATVLFSLLTPLAQAEYSVIRGEQWTGVKVGDSAPRKPDQICRDSDCIQILKQHRVPSGLSRLGIRVITFENLSHIEGVTSEGNRLYLPDRLGREIYRANDTALDELIRRHQRLNRE